MLVGRPAGERLRYLPVDSCIQFFYQLDGTHVVTVEGLSDNGDLHPVQQAMVDCHGSQCGYCTPGFVMALAGWAEAGCRDDRRLALTGNLCRCTGYLPILDAAAAIAAEPVGVGRVRGYDTSGADRGIDASWPRSRCRLPTVGGRSPPRRRWRTRSRSRRLIRTAVIVAGGTELGVLRNKRGDDPTAILTLARDSGPGTDRAASRLASSSGPMSPGRKSSAS